MGYVVLDFETTGLNYKEDDIIECAVIKLDDDLNEVSRFSTFVYTEKVLSERITELTSITQSDVENGMQIRHLYTILNSLITSVDTLVCHHVPFDSAFLSELGIVASKYICTKTLISAYEPNESSSLIAVCARYNIKHENAHHAMSDVEATANILREFRDELDDLSNTLIVKADRPLTFIPAFTKCIRLDENCLPSQVLKEEGK
ncbi:3'-5' exonuclease [Listeria monocytogenes]|nr:3'-5' exonuclease [Listeria monocytogenes]